MVRYEIFSIFAICFKKDNRYEKDEMGSAYHDRRFEHGAFHPMQKRP
jgi:hypothetical protein